MALTTPRTSSINQCTQFFIPSCAGTSRHERFVRKHVPDFDTGWTPAPAGDKRRHRSSEYSHRSTMC